MRQIFLAFCLAGLAVPALAQTFTERLFSDQALTAATTDIPKILLEEARALRDLFASCVDSISSDKMLQHYCDAELEKYELEYGSGRELDKMLLALALQERLFRIGNYISQHPDELSRYSKVRNDLKRILSLQFAIIRLKGAHP